MACKSTNPTDRAKLLPEAVCSAQPKPRSQGACLLQRCHKPSKLQWLVSAWSQVGPQGQGPPAASLLPLPLPLPPAHGPVLSTKFLPHYPTLLHQPWASINLETLKVKTLFPAKVTS